MTIFSNLVIDSNLAPSSEVALLRTSFAGTLTA